LTGGTNNPLGDLSLSSLNKVGKLYSCIGYFIGCKGGFLGGNFGDGAFIGGASVSKGSLYIDLVGGFGGFLEGSIHSFSYSRLLII